MSEIEWRGISPEELIREIENSVRLYKENKYAFQVGLKDLDFEINEDVLRVLGATLPFTSVDQADQALCARAIIPIKSIEYDDTEHQVLQFDHRPVGYSGFMDCVTHSFALTDKGLFEVGRYPGVSLSEPGKQWQRFIHRRLATPDELHDWQETHEISTEQLLERVYNALTGIGD